MSINPTGAALTVDGNALIIADHKKSQITEPFDRLEYSYNRLKSAPNDLGQKALQATLLGNTPAQIVIGSISFQQTLVLKPDVTSTSSNFQNFKKKFNITRYEITGGASLNDNVNAVQVIAKNHAQQLSKFQAYLQKSASLDTSYEELLALQSENFSYLTTTGISAVGNIMEGTVTNVLITSFTPSIEYEELLNEAGDDYDLLKSFSMTLEVRTITSLDVVA